MYAALPALAAWAPAVWASAPAGEGKGGLLDPDPGAAVWTIVVFALVVIVLGRFAWRPMLKALAAREEKIRDSLSEAEAARHLAHKTAAERETLLAEARREAHEIIEEGRRDKVALLKRLEDDQQTELAAKRAQAEREILLAKNQALHELLEQTAHLSTDIAGKVLGRVVSAEQHQDLIRKEIDAFRAQHAR